MNLLNQQLYNLLKIIFSSVEVYNAGQKAKIRYSYKKIIIDYYGETYAVNCPFCNDSKNHLWIPYLWGANINNTKRIFPAKCFRNDCLKSKQNRKKLFEIIYKKRNLNSILMQNAQVEESDSNSNDVELDTIPLPIGCIPAHLLPESHPAIQYLMSRGFTDKKIYSKYLLHVPTTELNLKIKDRIIIPIIHEDNNIIGWQARAYKEGVNPKYTTPTGLKLSYMLFNLNYARKHDDYVVIVEGPLDAIRLSEHVDDRVVATFGKKISNPQIKLINTMWKKAYVAFDPDARKETISAARKLRNAEPILLQTGDPGSSGWKEIINFLNKTERIKS